MPASDDERIQPALHVLLSGDADGLRAALAADPESVNLEAGGNTMLEWLTQPGAAPPSSEMVDVLVGAGADLDRAMNLAGCWNLADLCRQLLAAGTDPAARADAGITPLESAALHGSTEAADVLVEHGLHRPTLWLAAAAGLLPAVRDWVAVDGSLQADPGPYRPNWADVGRLAGAEPTGDPAEVVGESFVFAALNDRRNVVDYLLDAGVDIDSRPYRNTTALHFAVQFGRLEMVRHLLHLRVFPTSSHKFLQVPKTAVQGPFLEDLADLRVLADSPTIPPLQGGHRGDGSWGDSQQRRYGTSQNRAATPMAKACI